MCPGGWIKARLDAHGQDEGFGGHADQAGSLRGGQLTGGYRAGDGRTVFALVDAPVGPFAAQVSSGQHDGRITEVEMFVVGGDP